MSKQEKQECRESIMSGWHLKKEVAITNIMALFGVILFGLLWAASVETRFQHVSGEMVRIEQKTDLQMKNITVLFNRIDRKLNKIDDKLDKKADK